MNLAQSRRHASSQQHCRTSLEFRSLHHCAVGCRLIPRRSPARPMSSGATACAPPAASSSRGITARRVRRARCAPRNTSCNSSGLLPSGAQSPPGCPMATPGLRVCKSVGVRCPHQARPRRACAFAACMLAGVQYRECRRHGNCRWKASEGGLRTPRQPPPRCK